MKQFKFTILLIAAFSVLLTSCDTGSSIKYIQKNKVLVLNQGNYTSQDASVYVYDEDTQIMTPNAFARANNNTRLGATLMSGTYSNYGIGYLLCSNPDKIEVINVLTLETLSNPIEPNLLNTREIAIDNEYIYVTNAGTDYIVKPDGSREYTKSYVSIYSQMNNSPIDTIQVGSDAQGLVCAENTIYVGTKDGIVKIRKEGNSFNKEGVYTDEEYPGAVKYLCYNQGNHQIYASIPDYGIIAYDPVDDRVRERYPVADNLDSNGYITMGTNGNIYTFATKYNDSWEVESSNAYKLDINTGNIGNIHTGDYLYSVGISPYSGCVFTSEANDFVVNSTVKVIDPATGMEMDSQTAGIGTFRYLFFTYYEEDKTTDNEKK